MAAPELVQLELLAEVDELVARLSRWAEADTSWEPLNRCRALVRRLLGRVETLRVRLEAPLVVAMFGGTGTGKSTLVNALVGRECSPTGRQRPTTTRPVLVLHPDTELEMLGLPADEFHVVPCDAPILRDIVLIDCPDPDTSETDSPGSNLHRLHQLLPHCDVLIYTSTQQKYRSARVADELGQAATGCRLLFVQTHADVDDDIRDDWRQQLAHEYEVPDVFFVDSLRALNDQLAGRRPSGDFGRLEHFLTGGLAASERIQIRRSNLIDLIQAALEHCRTFLSRNWTAVEQLEAALEEQRDKLTAAMANQLAGELQKSRRLWERRLLGAVTENWGMSPFAAVLRAHHGLAGLLASFGLFRARSSAQMALIGALQGARWLRTRQQEMKAESELDRLSAFGLDDNVLRESQFVISGYVQTAQMDPALVDAGSLQHLRQNAVRAEGEFLDDSSRRIDSIIDELSRRNSRFLTRAWYELLLSAYIGFVLYRMGKNFFYDSFIGGAAVLSVDFYVSAGVIFLLWAGVLVMAFTRRLRRGLAKEVDQLADALAETRIDTGLFPKLDDACREIELQRTRLAAMSEAAAALRRQVARSDGLGAPVHPRVNAVTAPETG